MKAEEEKQTVLHRSIFLKRQRESGLSATVDGESHRAGRLTVAPAAVDAADLCLRAGQRETLKVRPGRQERARNNTCTHTH